MNWRKTLIRILRGTSDKNIRFEDLCQMLARLGFVERIKGSYHIYHREGVEEILTLQPKGGLAKSYQVRQAREIIVRYHLIGTNNDR